MSSTVFSLPAKRYRRPSFSAAGVVSIISGALDSLLGLGVLVFSSDSSFPRTVHLGVGGFLLLVGILEIVTGWGLLRRLYWARIAGLMWAITLVSPTAPLAPKGDLIAWVIAFMFIGVGLWWLVLFTRKDADEEFVMSERKRTPPAAVSAVAWLLLLDPISLPFLFFLSAPTFLFGHSLPGLTGRMVSVGLYLVGFVAGLALLKCARAGFWLAVVFQFFRFASALITDFTPSALAELNRVMSKLASQWHYAGFSGIGRTFSFVEPLIMAVCLLFFWKEYRLAEARSHTPASQLNHPLNQARISPLPSCI